MANTWISLQRSSRITLIRVNRPLADLIVNAERAMGKPFALVFQLTWAHLLVVDPNVQSVRTARLISLARTTGAPIRVPIRAVRERHVES